MMESTLEKKLRYMADDAFRELESAEVAFDAANNRFEQAKWEYRSAQRKLDAVTDTPMPPNRY